jgi:hypothetical protein
MKRLSWLLLAVFCTALMRVQPVDTGQRCPCICCHCKNPGDCGMPCDRSPTPTPAPLMFAAEQAARVARPSLRQKDSPARLVGEKFFAPFVESATSSVAFSAAAVLAPPANVPLFKAHCSFLI